MSGVHLRAEGLACAVGGRVVVRDVELAVRTGEVVGLVGRNGSGKSTLLSTLAGILPPIAGRVLLDGTPLSALRPRERARRIAMAGQEEGPLADLTVYEAVALGRTPHRPPWAGGGAQECGIVARALAEVDLTHIADRPVDQLSGGERRRVVLARTLAQEAPLLALDEPTNHLDVGHQLELLELVRSLGRTVLVALHDLNLATAVCDRLVVLHEGAVHSLGAPTDVLTPEVVRDVFGVHAVQVRHPETGSTRLLLEPLPAGNTDRLISTTIHRSRA